MDYTNIKNFLYALDNFNIKKLECPNGRYKIRLKKFKKALKCYIRNFEDILAIIVFGSSVYEYPKFLKIEKKKKSFFGKEKIKILEKENKIQPNDCDILIITKNKYFNCEKITDYKNVLWNDGYFYFKSKRYMNIDIKNASDEEVIEQIKKGNTMIINSLSKGVLICKKEGFDLNKYEIKNISKRKVNFIIDGLFFYINIE
jgi:hypothetical protein